MDSLWVRPSKKPRSQDLPSPRFPNPVWNEIRYKFLNPLLCLSLFLAFSLVIMYHMERIERPFPQGDLS